MRTLGKGAREGRKGHAGSIEFVYADGVRERFWVSTTFK